MFSSKESTQSQISTETHSCDMDTIDDSNSKKDSTSVLDSVHSGCNDNPIFHSSLECSNKKSKTDMTVDSADNAAKCDKVQTNPTQTSLNFEPKHEETCELLMKEGEHSSADQGTELACESNTTEDLSTSNDSVADDLPENHSATDIPSTPECQNETAESAESPYDMRRTRRSGKRKVECAKHCPVCGVTVRLHELQSHYTKEVENLTKIQRNLKRQRRDEVSIKPTFVQVKSNRENRLTAKVARYSARAKNEVQCPVCSLRMSGTQEEVNKHVLNCINQDRSSDEYIAVDDDDESFEEYEFADQTRIRAISLVPGGYKTLHGPTWPKSTDDDEYLNVDVDDTQTYGQPQYTELDVIPNTTSDREDKELEQLRKAVLVDPSAKPHVLESRKWSTQEALQEDDSSKESFDSIKPSLPKEECSSKDSNHMTEQQENSRMEMNGNLCDEKEKNIQSSHVVSSLKEKIRDLEEQNKSVKCLICMEPYTKPVVSTTCWHVHCEECWLMTMGVKKLCPQCNMIVFPTDLRRIYL